MSWVVAAVAGSAVVGAGVSAYGAKKAADAAKSGSDAAINAEQAQYDQTRYDLQPYREVGRGALTSLADIYGVARPTPLPPGSSGLVGENAGPGYQERIAPPGFWKGTADQFDAYVREYMINPGAKVNRFVTGATTEQGNQIREYIDSQRAKDTAYGAPGATGYYSDSNGDTPFTLGAIAKPADWKGTDQQFQDYAKAYLADARTLVKGYSAADAKQGDAVRAHINAAVASQRDAWRTENAGRRTTQPAPGQPGSTPAATTPATGTAPATGVDRYAGFMESPGYQFRLDEGRRALDASASSRGKLFSGQALKATERFAQGTAADEWQNYVNGLQSLAGVGQSSTNATATAGANATNAIAGAYQNRGNAVGSSYIAGATGVNNAVQGGIGNYMLYNYLKG